MKIYQLPEKIKTCIILTVFLVLPNGTVMANDQSLEETLRRMELLLKQQAVDMEAQQKELEAQRRELAHQRELIRQLQTNQGIPGLGNALPTIDQPPQTSVVTSHDSIPEAIDQEASTAESKEGTGKELAVAELARREVQGTDDEVASLTPDQEDPSNTTYDPDFPGAWHLPGTTAAMKISGWVNMNYVNSFDPMLTTDRFIVGSIPPEGQNRPGAESGTVVTANQSRINFEVREETRRGTLRAFLEGDFEGEGDAFRLRHAYGQYSWALAGKTWSTLMDLESMPEEVDFEGINGMILSRQAQVRLFPGFGESMSFRASLEDPQTDVSNGFSERGIADLVMSVNRVPLGRLGDWNARVGVIIRDLQAKPIGATEDDKVIDAVGWGVTASGRYPMSWWGEEDSVLWQLTYGEGIGRYINDLNTVGGGDAVIDPQGKLHALPVFAGYLSYLHNWPKDFWFLKSWPGILRSNFTYSWVDIDNFDFQAGSDYQSTQRASANLIYLPTQNLRLGFELLWGERTNKDNSKGKATQLQVSARYSF